MLSNRASLAPEFGCDREARALCRRDHPDITGHECQRSGALADPFIRRGPSRAVLAWDILGTGYHSGLRGWCVRSEIGLGNTLEVYLPRRGMPGFCSTASNKGVERC